MWRICKRYVLLPSLSVVNNGDLVRGTRCPVPSVQSVVFRVWTPLVHLDEARRHELQPGASDTAPRSGARSPAAFQRASWPSKSRPASGDFDGITVLNPEAYERIEVAVNDVIPVARLLTAARNQPAAGN
jgi:hypothetical protein